MAYLKLCVICMTFIWHGWRICGEALTIGFLSIPKPIFDAINTLDYLLLSFLICKNILISATGASKTWLART